MVESMVGYVNKLAQPVKKQYRIAAFAEEEINSEIIEVMLTKVVFSQHCRK